MAFVLVITSLGFLAAFVMAGTSSAHVGFVNRNGDQQQAQRLAESALAEALARLQEDPSFGASASSEEMVEVAFPNDSHLGTGRVRFSSGVSGPYSTHNLESETSRPGYGGRLVPAYSVHLVAEGHSGQSRKTIEVIATLPPYPYAIASEGPIESDGELLVGSVNRLSETAVWTAEDLLPAHLASNDPNEASVVLGPLTTVIGDVRSVGGLELESGAVIKGQTLAYAEPVALPELPLHEYDPARSGGGYQELPPYLSDSAVVGTARRTGDLIVYGDLNLNNSRLYVEGHLLVQGRVLGKGLVVTEGGATITNGARVAGGQAVLLSGGDVTLNGGGPLGSFFQGLVYAEGRFEARDITVVGSFISRGEQARVVLRNARVLSDPNQTVYTPTEGGDFHFVPTGHANRPAAQVDGPVPGSFSIRVETETRGNRNRLVVIDPRDGSRNSVMNPSAATVQIATLANDIARTLDPPQGSDHQKNLVADAGSLLQQLSELEHRADEPGASSFDLNRFLSLADRMKVTLWREL